MTNHEELEAMLRETPGESETPHIDDAELEAQVQSGAPLTPAQRDHLSRCAECRDVLGMLSREHEHEGGAKVIRPAVWRKAIIPLAIAASIALIIVIIRPTPNKVNGVKGTNGTTTFKGNQTALVPKLALLATSSAGERRDLQNGGTIRLDERLGFKYGNPGNQHRSITVLGWDGKNIHWYYPEREGAPAFKLERKADNLSVRLPFDIALIEKHSAGTLKIVGAFDADPAVIAKQLREKGRVKLEGAQVFNITVREVK